MMKQEGVAVEGPPAMGPSLQLSTCVLFWAGMLTRPDYGENENENETKNHENENENENIRMVKFYV